MNDECLRLPHGFTMRNQCEQTNPGPNGQRVDDIRTKMTSVEHLSHPDRGCTGGPDAAGHPFTRKLQLDCAQESAAGQEAVSHITDERSHFPQCIDFALVSVIAWRRELSGPLA
jgi:hypothetical protein